MVETTKNEFEILNLYRKNIFLETTIRDIMKKLGKKSYQRVYEAVKHLEKENILEVEKFGKANKVKLKLSQESTTYLSFLEERESLSKKIPNMNQVLDMGELKGDIVLVTGSYAKNKQTKDSDIDLVIITKEKEVEKQKLIDHLTSLLKPEFHNFVISQKDFLGMLKSKEENFGKEIFKNHLIIINSNKYYSLIKEAIENGFRN